MQNNRQWDPAAQLMSDLTLFHQAAKLSQLQTSETPFVYPTTVYSGTSFEYPQVAKSIDK